jgi:hypothetical protein
VVHVFVVDLFSVQLTKQHALYFFDLNSKFYVILRTIFGVRHFSSPVRQFASSPVRQFASSPVRQFASSPVRQ